MPLHLSWLAANARSIRLFGDAVTFSAQFDDVHDVVYLNQSFSTSHVCWGLREVCLSSALHLLAVLFAFIILPSSKRTPSVCFPCNHSQRRHKGTECRACMVQNSRLPAFLLFVLFILASIQSLLFFVLCMVHVCIIIYCMASPAVVCCLYNLLHILCLSVFPLFYACGAAMASRLAFVHFLSLCNPLLPTWLPSLQFSLCPVTHCFLLTCCLSSPRAAHCLPCKCSSLPDSV